MWETRVHLSPQRRGVYHSRLQFAGDADWRKSIVQINHLELQNPTASFDCSTCPLGTVRQAAKNFNYGTEQESILCAQTSVTAGGII